MKLQKKQEYKNERPFILYYTITQVLLGVMLIAVQIVFLVQVFRLIRVYSEKTECSCPPITIDNNAELYE
ncbi:hypothetical protein D4R87_00870 [bacterium]|nr:MAG: hypothetical protein D4R87_00870 [bacterium]